MSGGRIGAEPAGERERGASGRFVVVLNQAGGGRFGLSSDFVVESGRERIGVARQRAQATIPTGTVVVTETVGSPQTDRERAAYDRVASTAHGQANLKVGVFPNPQ